MFYSPMYGKRSTLPSGLVTGLAIAGAILAAIIVIVVIVVNYLSNRPKPVIPLSNAPSAFTHFVSDKKTFSCLRPQGWSVSSDSHDESANLGFMSIDQWNDKADFQNGDARIMIVTDNKAELLAGGEINDVMPQKMPTTPHWDLNAMSGWDRNTVQGSVPGYQEGTVTHFGCPLGQGVAVGFTGAHDLHGMVATILAANNNHTVVVCMSGEYHWAKASPIFTRIMQSLGPGKS